MQAEAEPEPNKLKLSPRLAALARLLLREIEKRGELIEQNDLHSLTLVVQFNRAGKPRTILLRTESKSELAP